MSELVHLIYASEATHPFTENELIALLATARARNAEVGVTGMLLHVDGSFFQVLEGDEAVVGALYDRIACDRRHGGITKIIEGPIDARAFAEWSMGMAGADIEDLKTIDGLNDFFEGGRCLAALDAGRAKKLLRAFSEGRWRKRLN